MDTARYVGSGLLRSVSGVEEVWPLSLSARGVINALDASTKRVSRGTTTFFVSGHDHRRHKMPRLSEYELQRQEKIKENQELMKSLGIFEAASSLASASTKGKASVSLKIISPAVYI